MGLSIHRSTHRRVRSQTRWLAAFSALFSVLLLVSGTPQFSGPTPAFAPEDMVLRVLRLVILVFVGYPFAVAAERYRTHLHYYDKWHKRLNRYAILGSLAIGSVGLAYFIVQALPR